MTGAVALQVNVWRDTDGKRLVLAFRGTEQIKWKDFLTDALVAQHPFAPGMPDDKQMRLPPLLESATSSFVRTVANEGPDATLVSRQLSSLVSYEWRNLMYADRWHTTTLMPSAVHSCQRMNMYVVYACIYT